jgi:hypothetical protein
MEKPMNLKVKSMLKKLLGEKQYQILSKKIKGNSTSLWIRFGFMKPTLREVGILCRTDKVDINHTFQGKTYLDIYEGYFKSLRNNKISVLEIGVKGGSSLRTWKAYFTQARIFGLDIDPECKKLEEPRISIATGSQDDGEFLKKCFGEDQKFDIIIDDGSHINRHIIKSFESLFYDRLNQGGLYIIEDLNCSYQSLQSDHNVLERWPGMKYNDPGQNYDNNRDDMNEFFFDKIKELDYAKGNILTLHFWSMVCVITKTKNA